MNEKLSKYIDKAREIRAYSEEKEKEEEEILKEEEVDEVPEEEGEDEKASETIKGTVKRVFPFNANSEAASDSVAVVYVTSSHALKVRGRTIIVPSKSFIPVMLNGKASGSVELKYNEDKLQFEIVGGKLEETKDEGSEE